MKKIIITIVGLFVFNMMLNACEGDCVLCHPKLVQKDGKLDKDHEILVTCKTCHTQEEMEKIDMGSGCGQDCWDCHDIKKVTASKVKEHNGLQTCIDCHVTLDKNMFGGASSSAPAFSNIPTLNDLMTNQSTTVQTQSVETISEELNKSEANNEKSKEEKTEKKK